MDSDVLCERIRAAAMRAMNAETDAGAIDPLPGSLQAHAEVAAHAAVARVMLHRMRRSYPAGILLEAALRAEGAALSAEAWLARLRAIAQSEVAS